MGALVHERTAIELPGAAPGRLCVVALVAVPSHLDRAMEEPAESACLERLACFLDWRIEAILETDRKLFAGPARGCDHGICILSRERHGLFADDMGASFKAIDRDARVVARFRGDGADVGLFLLEHLAVVGVDSNVSTRKGFLVFSLPLLRALEHRIADRDERDPVRILDRSLDVLEADAAAANEGEFNHFSKPLNFYSIFLNLNKGYTIVWILPLSMYMILGCSDFQYL